MSEIRSRPSTPEYREGWDRVFGRPGVVERTIAAVEADRRRRYGPPPGTPSILALNPNDAHEHPPAD